MPDQFIDSTTRGRHVLDWVRKCLTIGQVSYRVGLTANLGGLTLQDVVDALRSAEMPAVELAQERWVIHGRNVDGIEIDVLVSVGVRTRITLLRASLRNGAAGKP